MLSRLIFLLPLALACGEPTNEPDPQTQAWSARYQAGRTAFAESRFAEAEQAFRQALDLAGAFPPGDRRFDRTLHQLAQLHVLQGQLAQAESLYQHLRALQEALPDDDGDKALTLDKLADTHRLLKRPAEAEVLYRLVLAYQQAHQGDPEVATTLKKLATTYRVRDLHAQADSLGRRAQAFKLRAQAHAYFVQGQYQKAEPVFHSALALQERYFGGDHPDLSRTCYYMGRLYDAQDRYRQAEYFYRRALALASAKDPDRIQVALDALIARAASPAN